MTEVMKSDVFFFVTTLAVIVVSFMIAIALVYLISILRDARKLSSRARLEGEAILDDLGNAREEVKQGGRKIFEMITALFIRKKNTKRKHNG
jgi:MFS superfamily sulfate permease-like transporter